MSFRRIACLLLFAAACDSAVVAESKDARPTYRFDLGSDQSPVAAGYVRVTAGAAYSPERKFGWESRDQTAFDVTRPAEDPNWRGPGGQEIPRDFLIFKEHNDLVRDGVSSATDLRFRVDLPNGEYRVVLTLGRLEEPSCSMQVFLNDEQVATDFDAKHWRSRRRPDAQYGFPRELRRMVTVKDGVLRIRIHGDDSGFRRRFEEEARKPAPGSYLEGTYFDGVYREGRSLGHEVIGQPLDAGTDGSVKPGGSPISEWGTPPWNVFKVWAWQDIGGPFTRNALCSIQVFPLIERPLTWRDGNLSATTSDPAVLRGVELFNAAKWEQAQQTFDKVPDLYTRALGYLWLAGRPQYEAEQRLLPQALEILNRLGTERPDDLTIQEDLASARRMATAMHRFNHRSAEQRSYTELILVTGEVASLQPDDPLYYKSRIYAGRSMYMIIPHRWTYASGVGRQMFEELERAGFADNRYVRWFLHDEWTPQEPDWVFKDYTALKQGAPQWAADGYEAYNRELDIGEWWIRNRQAADGSMGGGWGDDVEILRSLGAFIGVCPDASPLLLDGVRKVVDGVWNSGSIDRQAGYFADVHDSEHSAEWTADTLPLMLRLDHGNPVYVERALKSGKLMRDMWMGRTAGGHLMMRSNYLGATGVGKPGTHSDSRINFRAAAPARGVLAYNNLPALQRIYVDWADAWWTAAMSTDRGKPAGVIPQEIAYPSGRIGGENSPTWFMTARDPGTCNYNWEGVGGYQFYLVDLFLTAHRITGDAKYLQPLQLQADFVEEHLPASVRDSTYFQRGERLPPVLWDTLKPGSDAWVATKLGNWPAQWASLRNDLAGSPVASGSATERLKKAAEAAAAELEGARRRWPHATTEAMATDRMHYNGMGTATRLMTGFGDATHSHLVTYRGLGRTFAAVVLEAQPALLEVVIYNLDSSPHDAAIVPWILNQGDEFEMTFGPDDDNDGRPERVTQSRRFVMETSGQELPFRIEPRSQIVVEIKRVGRSAASELLADLAITAADIQFRSEYGKIDVAVHNIGAEPAHDVVVALLDHNDKELGRRTIPHLAPPLNLDPQIVPVGFEVDLTALRGRSVRAQIDPDGRLREITRRNNQASAVCPQELPRRKVHSDP